MTIIANRYQIETELGKGGMGTVYRATNTQTKQTVAIKQLKTEIAQPDLIERFQREGEALRELNHPNIVKMLDMVEQDGLHYLIMEYIPGGDLQQLLKEGQLPVQRCLKLALDLSDALTRAHKLDIIHRDLKPANVLIAEDGTLRLSDFGVAIIGQKERVTETNTIMGTLDYLPPEIFHNGSFDTRSDIWAFGVILFEMLTGKAPFTAESVSQLIFNIIHEEVPDLEELRPDAPIALVDLIYRMLDKDPYTRIASVRHVGADLEDILEGRDTSSSIDLKRFDTPIPTSLFSKKDNLPVQTSSFVGRESELSELSRLLDNPEIRLMTILAPGGMGKTSLSVELGRQQLVNFEDGVFFVELAPLSAPDEIISAIAEAVVFKFFEDGRSQKQQILDYFANKQMLLIMDNFEHLLAGANIVSEILKTAPNMQIIATSRQALKQTGETLFHLSGMDFPHWETPEDALNYAAVKLFMNSAMRALPSFELTVNNLDHIARICRLVQGMPLGIVLAASWLAMLSPEEIAQEMQQSMDILEDETGQIPERQHSIRAVMDYSWEMMNEAEQKAFMKMSIFRGGFSREAAQELAGASLRLLMSLSNKSLIRRNVENGRYEIHELLRQYALEKLQESGQEAEIRTAHSRYYLNYGGQSIKQTMRIRFGDSSQLIAEHDNITEAWHKAIENKDIAAIETGLMLYLYYIWQLQFQLAETIFEKALAIVPDENHILSAILKTLIADFRIYQGRISPTEIAYIEEGLAALKDTEYTEFYVNASFLNSFIIRHKHGLDAWADALREVRDLAYQFESTFHYQNCVGLLSYYETLKGDYDKVEPKIEDTIQTLEKVKDFGELSYRLAMIGEISMWRGDFQKARERIEASIAASLKVQHIQKMVDNQVLLGLIAFWEGDYPQLQYYLNEINTLRERLGLSYSSIKDSYALKVRLNLAQNEPENAQKDLLELLNFGLINDANFVDFTGIAAADWLIYHGQQERVPHILHFIRYANVPPAVRKCAQLLIESLPEQDVNIDTSNFDMSAFLQELKAELEK